MSHILRAIGWLTIIGGIVFGYLSFCDHNMGRRFDGTTATGAIANAVEGQAWPYLIVGLLFLTVAELAEIRKRLGTSMPSDKELVSTTRPATADDVMLAEIQKIYTSRAEPQTIVGESGNDVAG